MEVSLVSNWTLRPWHLHWVTQDKPVEVSLVSNWILRSCDPQWVTQDKPVEELVWLVTGL